MTVSVGLSGALLLAGLAMLILVWIGYPGVVALWAWLRPQRYVATALDAPAHRWPTLSVIVAAHNEAACIATRLHNLSRQDYPASRIELIVSEDGSTDGTVQIVRGLVAAGMRVRLLTSSEREGKAAALNRAAAAAGGDVLVFTDANNEFAPSTLRYLAAPFADADVGAVTGRKRVAEHIGLGGGEGVYWRFEGWLCQKESITGTTVAAFGEALAVRRSLFRPLPEGKLVGDDLFVGLTVLTQRRRVLFAPQARSWERGAADAGAEWERRRRMGACHWAGMRAARAVGKLPPWAALKVAFHQVLRPLSALWLALAVIGAVGTVTASAPVWLHALAIAVLSGIGWTAVVAGARRLGWRLGRAEAPYFFCLALAAGAAGAWRYARGTQPLHWQKARGGPPGVPSPSPELKSNREGILNGLFWASSSFLSGKLLVFASVIVLARLLSPKAFGEVALATTTTTVLEIFGTLGLTSALIFEEQAAEAAANICFWITLATSGLELAAAWFLAPWLATFFHEPELVAMVRALSVSLVLLALGNTHDFLLRRRLAFRTKFIPDLGQAGAKGLAAIVLALLGFGAWSLIWGQVLGTAVATLLLWYVVPWRPHRGWDQVVLRRMVRYAKHIYFLDGSSVLLTNLETITIGRMLSDTLLGFYTLAFRLPEVVLLSTLNVVTRVTFPGFSRLQSDVDQLRRTLLDTARYTTLLTLPLAAGMGMLAPAIIYSIYGKHWGLSIPVLEVLALYAGIRCLIHSFGDGYKAIGRPDVLSATAVLWWVVLPPSLILGARWGGIVGVAWGQVVTRSIMTLFHIYLVNRFLQIRPAALLRCFAPALEATGIMMFVLWLARPWAQPWGPRMELVALVPLGAAVYFAAIVMLHPQVARVALSRLQWRRAGTSAAATESAA